MPTVRKGDVQNDEGRGEDAPALGRSTSPITEPLGRALGLTLGVSLFAWVTALVWLGTAKTLRRIRRGNY